MKLSTICALVSFVVLVKFELYLADLAWSARKLSSIIKDRGLLFYFVDNWNKNKNKNLTERELYILSRNKLLVSIRISKNCKYGLV